MFKVAVLQNPQHFKQSKLYKSPKQPVIYPTQSTISFYHILQYDALKSEKASLKLVSLM